MSLLRNAKVTYYDDSVMAARRYRVDLHLQVENVLDDRMRVRAGAEGQVNLYEQIAHELAGVFYEAIYAQLFGKLRSLGEQLRQLRVEPGEERSIMLLSEALFEMMNLCRPIQEDITTLVQGLLSAESQGRQESQQMGGIPVTSAEMSQAEREMWLRLIQRAGHAERPPEDAEPGYLPEEEDLGDNMLLESDDAIAEAKAFIAGYLKDIEHMSDGEGGR